MQNNISFKGCIPVEFFAKHPKTQKYVPVVKPQNVKKCQRFVVRNLNKTLIEANRNDVFIKAYKAVDSDYAKVPMVRSFYDSFKPIPKTPQEAKPFVYLFTGKDIDKLKEAGKRLGKVKSDIFEATGEKESPEISQAKRRYRAEMKDLTQRLCPRVKDEKGNNLVMRILFKPEYNSKGDLKKFDFQDVFFYTPQDEYYL